MQNLRCRPSWLVVLVLILGLLPPLSPAVASPVETIVSPKGIRIWLLEDHSAPTLSLSFRFLGGAADDPQDKIGLAHLAAELFLEGGGNLNNDDYLGAWSRLGASATVEARFETLKGTVRLLSRNRRRVIELLRMAVVEPRFDPDTIDRVKQSVITDLQHDRTDLESVAYDAYYASAYEGHPLAHPIDGTEAGINAITIKDLKAFRASTLARDHLSFAAVGDVTASEIAGIADRLFGELPAHAPITQVSKVETHSIQRHDIGMKASQAEVVFGFSLPDVDESKAPVAALLNYTLGGSAFTSRLFKEVREKRGLTYTISTNVESNDFNTEIVGDFGSTPSRVDEALGIVRSEFARLAEQGPSADELSEAKAALAGDYLRGLIRQSDFASELSLRMTQGYPTTFIDDYPKRLSAVSLEDVRALARRVLSPNRLVVVTVGASER
jgi:zinc protease